MTIEEVYKEIGDYNDVLCRFGKESSIIKFTLKFKNDLSYEKLLTAVNNEDLQGTFSAAHALKGLAGNLSFTKLQKVASELTEQMRPLKEKAKPELVEAVKKAYEEIIETINELQI